jgi:O-antigen ligase
MVGSVQARPVIWAASLAALAAGAAMRPRPAMPFTLTAGAVALMAAWLVASNSWLNPSYSAAAPYHAAFLVGGFAIGSQTASLGPRALLIAALSFGMALAGWVLWQKSHGAARPTGMFETPATLSTVLNLILLPALACAVFGARQRPLLAGVATFLIAGMASAESRGGWLGLVVGVLAMLLMARRRHFQIEGREMFCLAACIVGGIVVAEWISWIPAWLGAPTGRIEHSMASEAAVTSAVDRLGMYELAVRNLSAGSLTTGIGYLGYYYAVQAGAHAVSAFVPGSTYFVHNDYLQMLLELGVPGIVLLIALVLAPLLRGWHEPSHGANEESLRIVAASAALASMAAHATVDFPFYVPICLLLFGTAAGMLDGAPSQTNPGTHPLGRLLVVAMSTVFAWTLLTPLAAEAAAARAHQLWRGSDGRAGYWFEVARRVAPRDWRYHWQAGQFWYAQAVQANDPEAARRADDAFKDGVDANARDVRNLTARIAAQLTLAPYLKDPVDLTTLVRWSERAVTLAPADPALARQLDSLRRLAAHAETRSR